MQTRTKLIVASFTGLLFALGALLLLPADAWRGSSETHLLLETLAWGAALAGALTASVRYQVLREREFLFIALGLLGAALLDGFHAVVTSRWFIQKNPSGYEDLIAWSWGASRLYFALLMVVASGLRRTASAGKTSGAVPVGVAALAVLPLLLGAIAFFTLVSLPSATQSFGPVHRVQEFIPGVLLFLALTRSARAGIWKTDVLERWLLLSLVIGCLTQFLLMPYSQRIYDPLFDLAHTGKALSYALLFMGLLSSTHETYARISSMAQEVAEASKEIRRRMVLLISVMDSIHEGLIMFGADGSIERANPRGIAMAHLTRGSTAQSIMRDALVSPDGESVPHDALPHMMALRGEKSEMDLYLPQLYHDSGGYVNAGAVPLLHDPELKSGVVLVLSDITERKTAETQILHQAGHDSLTGLPNRGLVMDRLNLEIARRKRYGGIFAVAFLDLDGFKPINDTHGHASGDAVLQAVAQRLTATLRATDTVARFGGDEFLLLLPDPGTTEELRALLKRTLDAIAPPIELPRATVRVGSTAGVAVYPNDAEQPEALVARADAALYKGKRSGKNRIVLSGDKLHQ